MAGSVNKVILVGNVGKDPEIRRTQDGRPIANINIATSESWRDKNSGERKEKTEWHRVVIFNENLCKVVEQYVKKGAKLYIEGQLQTRKWTDQAGVEKFSTEVVLQGFNGTLTMLDSRNGAGAGAGGMSGGMQESGGADYGADNGYSAGGGNGYGSSSGGAKGGASSRPSSGGSAASKSSGGAAKPFDKQLDDEIPF
jgi:single-strand DNA-binding protein